MKKVDVPKLIKSIRKRHELTQAELAHQIGVSTVSVNRWEKGHARPIPALMARLKMVDELKKF